MDREIICEHINNNLCFLHLQIFRAMRRKGFPRKVRRASPDLGSTQNQPLDLRLKRPPRQDSAIPPVRCQPSFISEIVPAMPSKPWRFDENELQTSESVISGLPPQQTTAKLTEHWIENQQIHPKLRRPSRHESASPPARRQLAFNWKIPSKSSRMNENDIAISGSELNPASSLCREAINENWKIIFSKK